MSVDKHLPIYREVVPRLVSGLLYLKLRHPPYPWQIRVCESLVFGELTVQRPPDDIELGAIHEVASDLEQLITLYELGNDDKATERPQG